MPIKPYVYLNYYNNMTRMRSLKTVQEYIEIGCAYMYLHVLHIAYTLHLHNTVMVRYRPRCRYGLPR